MTEGFFSFLGQIGYMGMICAFGTLVALIASIWTRDNGENIAGGVISAFILAVTIVVVAIPEGLPLAVTIALAYSSKKMYKDQCFIRMLAACETMGNVTNICSDKTGTLTENRMTVVEGWFADVKYSQHQFHMIDQALPKSTRKLIVDHVSINRLAFLSTDKGQQSRDRPDVIGSKTEGALMLMCRDWGFDCEQVKKEIFNESTDRIFSFNSNKKRSTAVVQLRDGSGMTRVYCKGASEWVLKSCSRYLDHEGNPQPMTTDKQNELEITILKMADNAMRTLLLAHVDIPTNEMPTDWMETPPDQSDLVCDCIVGIIDPLRADVKESVAIAQQAGVVVRMVTGDNINTASAIARQCGILNACGTAVEGPHFRKMTPSQLDELLPSLQVMARSSPEDKCLLVSRLNGHSLPEGKEEWEKRFKARPELTWERDRDKVLPGHKDEWSKTRPEGGEVVGVTGDGTNDAPALKAADVGLAMGITGTKVARAASDIVILDDRFSSIVRSIMWGRAVFDNIRKFLQFQLTVNAVALILVFIGAVVGFGQPLNAVQMLWVNLVMDTLGALALGTEAPTMELLKRKPYKRSASLISRPMIRNIICQSTYQLILLFVLMFAGPKLFDIKPQTLESYPCASYTVNTGSTVMWNPATLAQTSNAGSHVVTCATFSALCNGGSSAPRDLQNNQYCYEDHVFQLANSSASFTFSNLAGFGDTCLVCAQSDYTQGSIIFNAFIWCQIFNEYSSRSLFNGINFLRGIASNIPFLTVSVFTIGLQIMLIEVGGDYVRTAPLTLLQWVITIALGAVTLPIGVLMRFIPADEDERNFFNSARGRADSRLSDHGGTFVADGTIEIGRLKD